MESEMESTNTSSSQICDAEVWAIFSIELYAADDIAAESEEALPAPHKYSREHANGPAYTEPSKRDTSKFSKRYRAAIGLEINVAETARWSSASSSPSTGSPANVARLFQRTTTC